MTTPSPAPWKAERLTGAYWVKDANGKRFCRIIATPHNAADARLIEKAPAMLELLKRFLGCMEIQNSHLLNETSELIADLEMRS